MFTYNKIDPAYFRSIIRFFIFVGLVIFLVAATLFVYRLKKLSSEDFISTEAKIINSQILRHINAGPGWYITMYQTTLEFNVEKGNYNPLAYIYVLSDDFGDGKQGDIGEYVPILYNAKNPDIIFINRFRNLWGYYTFFGTIGLIFTFMGSWLYRNTK